MNKDIGIKVMDDPGPGGASRCYVVDLAGAVQSTINFQKGPLDEEGLNGLSNEVLLAIVEDRLQGFQSGPFVCRENAIALTKVQEALLWLHKRTKDRIERGVEGKLEK